jgi:chromosome segregation ATPase
MRIYLEPDDQMLKEINQAAKENSIGKAQFVLEAVDHYLHDSDRGEIASIKKDLDRTREDLDRARRDLDQKWSEISTLREKITALDAELDSVRSSLDKAMITNQELQKTADQARVEAETLRRDQDHYKSTLEMKDKQIGFLEGHVSQLTQLSLKPGEEEIRKKGWWQFWK